MDNSDKVASLKAEGNEALQNGRFEDAIRFYTEAIELDGNNHVLYSNRSAAYVTAVEYTKALEDAEKAIELKADWIKGYARKGAALCLLGRYDEAVQAYDKGLEFNPFNDMLKDGRAEVVKEQARVGKPSKREMYEQGGAQPFGAQAAPSSAAAGAGAESGPQPADALNVFGDDMWEKLGANESTKFLLADAEFVAKMKALQANPSLLQHYGSDPRMLTAITVLLGLDPTKMRMDAERQQDAQRKSREEFERVKKEREEETARAKMEDDTPENVRSAAKEKQLGNAAYAKKEFEVALGHYDAAIELDPRCMTYYLNKAAVLLEQGDYTECIRICEKSIETGRENRADFKLIAKAFARIGNAWMKQEKYAEAIEMFEKSSLEHRTDDVTKKLKLCKELLKKREEAAYINPELAESLRLEGNEAFKAGDFAKAVALYTDAAKRNPKDVRMFSNRAACYMKLTEWDLAMKDCEMCIELDANFVKGYTRKAQVHWFRKEYHKCLETYDAVMKIDPNNQEAMEGAQRTVAAIQAQTQSGAGPDPVAVQKALADPEIRKILEDPYMRSVLADMGKDPQKTMQYMQDERIRNNVEKLLAAGIIQTGPAPPQQR